MIGVAIRGIGVVAPFGCGNRRFAAALAGEKTAAGTYLLPVGNGTVDIPALRADTGPLDEFIPRRNLRRVDHYSRMALLGACLALRDGSFSAPGPRTGLIVASGYGATAATFAFLDSFINDGDLCSSPTHFANSVHNSAAATLAMHLGITGPSLTVSQFGLSMATAVMTACLWLAEGRVDSVLVGGVEELSDLVCYSWYRRRTGDGPAAPPPGEGAAFLLLGRDGDSGPSCCRIDSVQTGRAARPLPHPETDLLLLNRSDLTTEVPRAAVSLAHLYGTQLAAAALDIAAAALMLREKSCFAVAEGVVPGRIACRTEDGDACGLVALAAR